MSELLIRPKKNPDLDGNVIKLTPESAGWKYVGFEVYKVEQGKTFEKESHELEMAVVLLSGKANAVTKNQTWKNIGQRMSVFDKTAAYTIYVSSDDVIRLEALTDLEIAVCTAPSKGTYESRLIRPEDVEVLKRGYGHLEREIHNILPGDKPADSLFIFEVFTPDGNWSSYPPHKHDEDNLPHEAYLEETYYFKTNPADSGFAIQRVYTDNRSLDEAIVVRDGDLVIVPKGYHPVSNPPGYDLYYLNVMAGPVREWKFTNDRDHEWLLSKSK
jgi:5-deoxy-glucuronate isomerase